METAVNTLQQEATLAERIESLTPAGKEGLTRIVELCEASDKKQTHVCPYCLQDVLEGDTCACLTEGDPEGLTVKARIEALTLIYRERLLEMIEVYEACEKNQAKREREAQDVATLTPPPSETSLQASTSNSLTWEQNFMWMRYGIGLHSYSMVDEAVCALMAVRDRIESDVKASDVRTVGMLVCIETYLQNVYDTLRENRENIVEAFNACFPDSAIPA